VCNEEVGIGALKHDDPHCIIIAHHRGEAEKFLYQLHRKQVDGGVIHVDKRHTALYAY
jgi:hypothetical protein